MAYPAPALGSGDSLDSTIAKFRANLPLYSAAVLKIRDKDAFLTDLSLNEPQLLVLRELTNQLRTTGRIRAIILKARQEGVSTLTAARFFRGIHLWSGRKAMVIADTLQRAGTLYEIYARFLEHLPTELRPEKRSIARQRWLAFTHDSELSVRPSSDSEAGRAMTLHMLHASELAFWGNEARETWVSLMQAVPSRGSEVIVESTAKGAGGLFHELWQAAERGDAGWIAVFLPWWIYAGYEDDDPDPDILRQIVESPDDFEVQALGEGIPFRGESHRLSVSKLAWRRRIIVENFGGSYELPSVDAVRAFQQEYPATAEEAFLVSGSCFFDERVLRRMTNETRDPIERGWIRRKDEAGASVLRVERSPRGGVRVWDPPDEAEHYVIGADTAEGKIVIERALYSHGDDTKGDRDYTSAVVLRVGRWLQDGPLKKFQPPRVVAEIHGYIAPEVFAEQLEKLGHYYSCGGRHDAEPTARRPAKIGVERNHSSGVTVIRLLREHYRYSPLYWQKEINRRSRREGRQPGWRTDETSRMMMLDALGEMVRREQVEIPSRDVVGEMVTFVVTESGKPMGEENCHDDRVIALAIAVQMALDHRHTLDRMPPPFEPEPTTTGM